MPKKRKKRVGHPDLVPLEFLENPLNMSQPFQSPLYGALNPVTARSVPIEHLQNISWISPPFDDRAIQSKQLECHSIKKLTRTRKVLSDCKSLHSKERSSSSKYKPLLFVSDQDENAVMHKSPELENNKHRKEHRRKGSKNAPSDSEKGYNSGAFEELNDQSFRISTPVVDLESVDDIPKRLTLLDGVFSPLDKSTPKVCSNSNDFDNSELNNDKMCVSSCSPIGFEHDKTGFTTDKCKGNRMRRHKQDNDNVFENKHKKLLPFLELDQSLCSPPAPLSPDILVKDTPECDYNLNFRQRQIKYGLRNRQHLFEPLQRNLFS